MSSNLPIVRDVRTRAFFLAAAIISIAIYYLTNSTGPQGLTPIFHHLFIMLDSWGAFVDVLILVAAAFVSRRLPAGSILLWLGEHPGSIAFATFVILSVGSGLVYLHHPLAMDEYTQLFQSRIFAAGHLCGHFPPALMDWLIPEGFQNYFLFVSKETGAVASSYWPSFALLLTPFTFLGIPWCLNPLISAATVMVVRQLAVRIFGDLRTAGLAVLLTVASPVFYANGISYYSMPAHLLANSVFALLLTDPTPRRVFVAGVVGSIALTLHNPMPHLLFALPWLVWLATRPDRVRLLACAAAGYAPLCVLLGLGWFWFTAELRQDHLDTSVAAAAQLEHIQRLSQAFALPDSMILWARLIGLAKIWVWAVPGLLLLSILGVRKHLDSPFPRLLLYSAVVTFVGMVFVPVDQGHGWGFRYFHPAWLALPILAAAAFTPRNTEQAASANADLLSFVVAASLLTFTCAIALRFFQMHDFISAQVAQVPAHRPTGKQIVILDPRFGYYIGDLVQNDPWLRDETTWMITRGSDEDARMMHESFPHLHRVYADQFGTVWSGAAAK